MYFLVTSIYPKDLIKLANQAFVSTWCSRMVVEILVPIHSIHSIDNKHIEDHFP